MDRAGLVQATFDAWNRDDVEAWIATLSPDVVYHTSGVFPGLEPSYAGHDGIREFWRAMHEPWETLRIDVEDSASVGEEDVIVEFRFRATGAASGASVDLRFTNGARVRRGVVTELFAARTHEDALAKLGAG